MMQSNLFIVEFKMIFYLINLQPFKSRAVEMGANFLGEAIIFGVASSLIIWEQARYIISIF